MHLDDIIEFEEESTTLDFKKEQYHKQKYEDMIKDVIAMANAESADVKRIIFGVKQVPGKDNDIVGLDSDIVDQAIFENVIQDNVEPNVNFKYFTYSYKEKKIGILEIFQNNNKPYMMKKKYKNLCKGDAWIRKGSRQSRLIREDLDKIFEMKRNSILKENVYFGFDESCSKEYIFKKTDYKKNQENKPSLHRKRQLEELLHTHYAKKEKEKSNTPGTSLLNTNIATFEIFKEKIKDRIHIGTSMIGTPLYCTEDELKKLIRDVEKDYEESDNYYIFEKLSNKLNFYIENKGTQFLEDVIIKIKFDAKVFFVSEEIFTKPSSTEFSSILRAIKPVNYNYPDVSKEEGYFVVKQEHEKIRHQAVSEVFLEKLRILTLPNVTTGKSEVTYEINARNLANNIEGTLTINIKD